MKIWFLNHYAVPPRLSGGTRHYDLLREMREQGEDVTLFASSFHYQTLSETMQYNDSATIERVEQDVPFVWIRTFPYRHSDWRRVVNMLSYAIRVTVHCLNRQEKPDVVVGSSVHPFAALAGYIIARRHHLPFVFEVRDLWPQTLIDGGIPKHHPFVLLLGVIERFLYAKADRIVALLPGASDYIVQRGVPQEKVTWIPNGVPQAALDAEGGTRPQWMESSRFNVTYCGAIGKCNSLENLLDAAHLLRHEDDVVINIVGSGPEKDALVAAAREKELRNVRFFDPVPKNEVSPILHHSDALVFNLEDSPVFRFGISSNKLYDYMAAGTPVIFCCNASNNPVQAAGAGMSVPAGDPAKLAEAILELKMLPTEERRLMGRNGRNYVQTHHAIPKLAENFISLLRTACLARKGARSLG